MKSIIYKTNIILYYIRFQIIDGDHKLIGEMFTALINQF